jgi:hypothetical protein
MVNAVGVFSCSGLGYQGYTKNFGLSTGAEKNFVPEGLFRLFQAISLVGTKIL